MACPRLVAVLFGASALLTATPMFVATGDLIWVSASDSRMYEINPATSNQNLSSLTSTVAGGGLQYGQMAFSADAKTAYLTQWNSNSVVAVDKNGAVTTFATGIKNPSGIVQTSTGKLLVASYTDGKIYDITAGGNFAAATAWAWGLTTPRDLIETSMGVVVAEQSAGQITLTGNGGDLTSTAAYATLAYATALAYYNNKIYAVSNQNAQVYEVAAGGAVSISNPYAKGRTFASLAVANGKLYAGTGSATGYASGIWDISSYTSSSYSGITPVAYNLPSADSMLGSVPAPAVVQAPVPEPGTAIAGIALLAFAGGLGKRLRPLRALCQSR